MREKSILLSKTFWFNVVVILAAILESQDVINVLPVNWLPYFTAVVSFGNIILRTFTSSAAVVRGIRPTDVSITE